MQDLIDDVVKWADDRNLITGSTPLKQLNKTSEEVNELVAAVGAHEHLLSLMAQGDIGGIRGVVLASALRDEITDAVGDIMVTLIIVAAQHGLSIEGCLGAAYDEIKDRTGKMIDGIFVKGT